MRKSLLIALAIACGVTQAATLEWTLENVELGTAGTATGEFFYDSTAGQYTSWSISVTASDGFGAFTYDTSTSTVDPCCDDEIKLTSNDMSRVFSLDFSNAGDSLSSPQQATAFERTSFSNPMFMQRATDPGYTMGEIVFGAPATTPAGAPEPGSLILLATGGLAVFVGRARRIT
jgi:hypothetical protein